MKRKLIMLLASCSLAIFIISPVGIIESQVAYFQELVQIMSHGAGHG